MKNVLWIFLWAFLLAGPAHAACSGSGFRTQEFAIFGDQKPLFTISVMDMTTCDGRIGLTSTTPGLVISVRPNNVINPTVYTQAAGKIETIPMLGTYTAPMAGKVRFREVDPINQRGVYEIQVAKNLFNVTGSKRLDVCVSGATNAPNASCMKIYLEKSASCGSAGCACGSHC